ncbi:hypothetical protein ACQV2X_02435 [Facklamia sp. P12945]
MEQGFSYKKPCMNRSYMAFYMAHPSMEKGTETVKDLMDLKSMRE